MVARTDDIVCVLERVDNQYLQFLSSLGVGPRNGNVIQASKFLYQNDNANLSDSLMSNQEALLTIRKLVKQNKK